MHVLDTIKKAPKWAWFAAAGVGLGAGAIKLYKDRGATDTTATDDTTADGSDSATANGVQLSDDPTATIVPPVIIGQTDSGGNDVDVGAIFSEAADAFTGILGGVGSVYQDVWGPIQASDMALNAGNAATIQALALAGSAPNSTTPTPIQLVISNPAPAQTGTPIAGSASTPTVISSMPQTGSAPGAQLPACKAPYSWRNTSDNSCYAKVCADGKGSRKKGMWHLYATKADQYMGATCDADAVAGH